MNENSELNWCFPRMPKIIISIDVYKITIGVLHGPLQLCNPKN